MSIDLVRDQVAGAGLGEVCAVERAAGGFAAESALVRLQSGREVFAKTLAEPPGEDVFEVEAEGLAALRAAGLATPDVLAVGRRVLVLSRLLPRRDEAAAWERLAHDLARLHAVTSPRFGWHRDGWLGTHRQVNTWEDDGHIFFARHRLLRWLPHPRLRGKLGGPDRRALERLCDRLPELLPERPASLTHGDCWAQNIMATQDGLPAVVDPAVSYTWAEVDLSHLWCSPHPPAAERFFAVYADVTGLDAGWRERMPLLHLRQLLALVAMFDDDWGSTDAVRGLLAPFRDR
ncbi:fructosamine kinase family protein [Dactylosporangium sp. CA-052675]|uniref:fructosamine kinase family protein n=1 Tax=Dactylosporangium sp. CA-052675 TaxID=3239927 RepID=UPI003D901D4E